MVRGAVDVDESYEEAAARELSEELGVRVSVRFMSKLLCQRRSAWLGWT
ncbi:NUDIX domain-containing protein [Streptomyces sp. BB1-1-1]|nr:NUDIX domain-containing protein [Streptomyces sp. BB1-1-1]WND40537.1 NUDIX domain-containing protein [Streptomyces sp. BB1-1-1]